jgi:hypothetical protein
MDAPPVVAMCFVLAVVVGYFAGRMMSIRDRFPSDRE